MGEERPHAVQLGEVEASRDGKWTKVTLGPHTSHKMEYGVFLAVANYLLSSPFLYHVTQGMLWCHILHISTQVADEPCRTLTF